MRQRFRKYKFSKMCKFLPKPTHTLHVMRPFESSLKFIVVSNNNTQRSVAVLHWCKDSENKRMHILLYASRIGVVGYMVDTIFEMKVMISKKRDFLLKKGQVDIGLRSVSSLITQNQLSAPRYCKKRHFKGFRHLGKMNNLKMRRIKC